MSTKGITAEQAKKRVLEAHPDARAVAWDDGDGGVGGYEIFANNDTLAIGEGRFEEDAWISAASSLARKECPSCGYTKEDAQLHMDHHLCKNAGKAPWEVISAASPLPEEDGKPEVSSRIWFVKIGECQGWMLPKGADGPMREAVAEAYAKLTGVAPDFIFSGWAGELSEAERAVVENRLPESPITICPKCDRPHYNMEDNAACRNAAKAEAKR